MALVSREVASYPMQGTPWNALSPLPLPLLPLDPYHCQTPCPLLSPVTNRFHNRITGIPPSATVDLKTLNSSHKNPLVIFENVFCQRNVRSYSRKFLRSRKAQLHPIFFSSPPPTPPPPREKYRNGEYKSYGWKASTLRYTVCRV